HPVTVSPRDTAPGDPRLDHPGPDSPEHDDAAPYTLEHPEFGGDSILPRCSGLGNRCRPRYRRLTEPRADHFSASVLSNICPAALSSFPPEAGAARQVFPGGLGYLLVVPPGVAPRVPRAG